MILENPSTVKLLGVLVEFGQRGATRELLQQKTGMGKSTFYRVLKPLLVRGVICEEGSLYRMPLDNPYNFLFKRLYSMEKIDELSPLDRNRVLSVIDHAKAHLQRHLLALWLVGSAAHQTMTKESDLDFLAILDDEEIEYLPDLAYDVHFITMTEDDFRARWREKNDFILTALRHGLLLEDKGFAQEFYLQPLPVQLQGREFHQDAEELEEQKERFMLSVRARLSDEATKALSHYAISIARRMLRVYNVLPAGKPDLLRASELLFGVRFHQQLELVLSNDKLDPGQTSLLMERCHYFEDIYQRFSSHLAYLQKFADLVTSSGELNERLVQQALIEISGGKIETYSGTDGLLEWNGQHYLVEVKSLLGPFTEAPLRQLERYLVDAQGDTSFQGLLIINAYRDIPLLERRDTFSEESLDQASNLGIKMRSAIELLRALNRSIIEKEESDSIADEFFQSAPQI
jgi:hypothetical protein